MIGMATCRLLAVLLLLIAPALLSSEERHPASKQLWTWFGPCRDGKTMRIEVVQRGTVLYRSSFPLCPISDPSKEAHRRLVFFFRGGHVFDGEFRTSRSESIEGNIWEAGTDPGIILFGVSFMTKKQLLLNTIHIAKADRASATEIDPGMVVRTVPVSTGTPR